MKKKFLLGLIFFFPIVLFSQTTIFSGAWFSVHYPSSFTAKPSLKSSSADGYESVFLVSPDKQVEFYVFSPQWNGDPTDIRLTSSENLVTTKKTVKGSQTHTWWTIAAKDRSYSRSYYQVMDELSNTIKVFGIKYKNQQAYNKYKRKYSVFQSSLIQYAD